MVLDKYRLNTAAPEQTERLGEIMGRHLRSGDVLALEGPLGAGKTALARGIARGWGSRERVTSPTFTLVHAYSRPGDSTLLYHLDCYRLSGDEEAETIGLADILADEAAVMIEWGGRVASWLPADRLTIALAYRRDQMEERSLLLTAGGPRSAALLAAVAADFSAKSEVDNAAGH